MDKMPGTRENVRAVEHPQLAPCLAFTRYFWASWKDSLSVLRAQNNRINSRWVILLLNTPTGVIPTSQMFGRPMARGYSVLPWVWIPLGCHSFCKHCRSNPFPCWPRSQLPLFWILQAPSRLLIAGQLLLPAGNYCYLHIYNQTMEH